MNIMNINDEVWMWVHQKYGMSRIVQKFYSLKTNNWSYLTVPGNVQLNRQNNETCDLQLKNSKIMMRITIIINHMGMYISINV